MKFTSTRNSSVTEDGATAVIDGIADDGGLFVPLEFPHIEFSELTELDYVSRADKILRAYFDFDVKGVAKAAYADFDGEPAPVTKLDDNLFVLELWHGKTFSSKDIGLSALPRLLAKAKAEKNDARKTLMLVATNGDTGKAALEGFKNVDGTEACVFYPTLGTSNEQELAMRTQDGDNVYVAGVTGNFDSTQAAVKSVLADSGLRERLAENNITMSSANSINIAMLVPQIVYYYSAYCDLVGSGEIKQGDKIDFIVPTGNFGSILAGWYAMKMGLPVNRLVCASNRNNVLTDFIRTGEYDANREYFNTDSPSMDILISGNLERLVFETGGRNAELTSARMKELDEYGRYSVTPEEIERIHEAFACDYADDEDIEDAISQMDDEYGYLIDPHTAAAYAVAMRREFVRPTVVLSTANPFKFAPSVLRAITGINEEGEDALTALEEESAEEAPAAIKEIFNKQLRFDKVVAPNGIAELIDSLYSKK